MEPRGSTVGGPPALAQELPYVAAVALKNKQTNKQTDKQQGPENYIQYLAITYNGKESEKEYIYICMYN